MSAIVRKLKLKKEKVKPQSDFMSDPSDCLDQRPVPLPTLGSRIVNSDKVDAVTDVLFIHGLTGDRESTWTAKGAAACWPESLLVNDLPQARIIMYGYDADVVNFWSMASQNTIGDHGQKFLTSLANLRDSTNTSTRPLAFIAHSLGGIVCQDALLKSKGSPDRHTQRILEETKAIIFMGTPHCGSGLAEWAVVGSKFLEYFRRLNRGTLEVLQQESEVMGRIRQEFHTMLRGRDRSQEEEIAIICFYEELPVRLIGEIVPKDSATLDRYASIGVHANHKDMVRFSDGSNPDYRNVLSELQRFVGSNNHPLEEELPSSIPTSSTSFAPPTPPAPSELPELQRQSHHSSSNQISSLEERDETTTFVERTPNKAPKPVNKFSGTFNTNGGKLYQGNEFNSGGGSMTF